GDDRTAAGPLRAAAGERAGRSHAAHRGAFAAVAGRAGPVNREVERYGARLPAEADGARAGVATRAATAAVAGGHRRGRPAELRRAGGAFEPSGLAPARARGGA